MCLDRTPGYANRPFRATDGKGTSTPQDPQPCRLLPQRNKISRAGQKGLEKRRRSTASACSAWLGCGSFVLHEELAQSIVNSLGIWKGSSVV